jgi:hypothetical protein
VQFEVLDQLIVGIGPYAEATLGTSDFFRHTYRVAKGPLVNLTFVISTSKNGICEKWLVRRVFFLENSKVVHPMETHQGYLCFPELFQESACARTD